MQRFNADIVPSIFFTGCPGRAGERPRDHLILFIFSFYHFTAEPQRLPKCPHFIYGSGPAKSPPRLETANVYRIAKVGLVIADKMSVGKLVFDILSVNQLVFDILPVDLLVFQHFFCR
jgi:hypothetical protein